MNKFIRAIGYIGIYILILTFILTILHYFNIINESILDISKLLIISISIIIGGYKVGKNSFKKGWLEGIKLALIIIFIFLILSWIFKFGFNWRTIIYYTIILISSMFGGMIGINKRKLNNNDNNY